MRRLAGMVFCAFMQGAAISIGDRTGVWVYSATFVILWVMGETHAVRAGHSRTTSQGGDAK